MPVTYSDRHEARPSTTSTNVDPEPRPDRDGDTGLQAGIALFCCTSVAGLAAAGRYLVHHDGLLGRRYVNDLDPLQQRAD